MEIKQIRIDFKELDYGELSPAQQILCDAARSAASHAYAPYSNFQVGAAVLLNNGAIVTGCNQENAAYPSGLCAERVALFSAGAQYPDEAVTALALAACSGGKMKGAISPCGACCQVLVEAEMRARKPIQILLCGAEQVRVLDSVSSLLPFSFSAADL